MRPAGPARRHAVSQVQSCETWSATMQAGVSNGANASHIRRRIIETAIRFYRRIGHKKTTVADIAREMAMSPASIYRFFPSKQAIDAAVVRQLLNEMVVAAVHAARSAGPAIWRLQTLLHAVNRLHVKRLTDEKKLHDLVEIAMQENWPVIRSYTDRIARIASCVIAVGQARGELRHGDSMTLARCVLSAMEVHSNPLMLPSRRLRPTLQQMMDFCIDAVCVAPRSSGWPARDRMH
jgi:AcrR family transcriptional regulator